MLAICQLISSLYLIRFVAINFRVYSLIVIILCVRKRLLKFTNIPIIRISHGYRIVSFRSFSVFSVIDITAINFLKRIVVDILYPLFLIYVCHRMCKLITSHCVNQYQINFNVALFKVLV